jgi:SAM-dependent methyltransferase
VPAPVDCPACGGTRVQLIDEWSLPGGGAHAAGCSDCGLLFVWPQPSQEVLDAYYAPDGGWHSSRATRRLGTDLSKTGAEGAIETILPALDRFLSATRPVSGARVFDFGCGAGAWLDSLQDRGWDTYGLEPSTDAAFQRHKRLLAVPSEPQFDLVIAYHVLEHLPRPLEVLRKLADVLVSGAHLLVSVPRLDTLAVHRQVDYCLHPRHHIVGFTEVCLRGLLARAGLEVVESFHMLESARSKGLPVRLQLLARKAATTPVLESDPDAALRSVIAAFVSLKAPARSSSAQPRVANH